LSPLPITTDLIAALNFCGLRLNGIKKASLKIEFEKITGYHEALLLPQKPPFFLCVGFVHP